jgi:hypothetical protein
LNRLQLVYGALWIRATICVFTEAATVASSPAAIDKRFSSLRNDIGKLRSGNKSDFTITVGGKHFAVHKALLSARLTLT